MPGGQSASLDKFDGPSGVLVCAEDYIIYKHQGAKEHRIPIPKRANPLSDPDRGLIIISAVMHKMRVSLSNDCVVSANRAMRLTSLPPYSKGQLLLPPPKRRGRSVQSHHRARGRRSSIPQNQILRHRPRRLLPLHSQIRFPLRRFRIRQSIFIPIREARRRR